MGLLKGLIKSITGGGGGGGSSQSTTTADQTGASEAGIVAAANATVAREDSVAIGGQNNRINLGTDASNNTGTLTVGYDAAQFQSALQGVGSNLTSALSAQSATSSDVLDKVLGKLSTLAESKQTDGVSGLSKTALIAIGIVVAGFVVWAFARK